MYFCNHSIKAGWIENVTSPNVVDPGAHAKEYDALLRSKHFSPVSPMHKAKGSSLPEVKMHVHVGWKGRSDLRIIVWVKGYRPRKTLLSELFSSDFYAWGLLTTLLSDCFHSTLY